MRQFTVKRDKEATRSSHVLAVSDDLHYLLIADPDSGKVCRVRSEEYYAGFVVFDRDETVKPSWINEVSNEVSSGEEHAHA